MFSDRDIRKSFNFRLAAACVLSALFPLPMASGTQQSFATAAPVVAVSIDGVLPGFDADQAPQFISAEMTRDEPRDWSFAPAKGFDHAESDRIELHLTSEPYAGGGVRQFIPIPSLQRLFGARRMLSIEAQFYWNGQLRSHATEQAVVLGGADDKDLSALIAKIAHDLVDGSPPPTPQLGH